MKNITRHQERVWALQILYSLDIKERLNFAQARVEIKNFKKDKDLYKDNDKPLYFEEVIKGVVQQKEDIDKIINKYAIDWELERMAFLDRNILRIALFEINNNLPVGVAINEAVELAKEFGDEKSPSFINGILAKAP